MNLFKLLEQIASENELDISELIISKTPRKRVLQNISDGDKEYYIVTDILVCNRCSHRWEMRGDKIPDHCPSKKCHSPYWNKSRVREVKEK